MSSSSSSSGIGFTGLLTIVFIVLKLTHYIDWRWRWVLAPIWGAAALTILFFVAFVALAIVLPKPAPRIRRW